MADAIKKGSLIRVNREAYMGSLEARASASEPPAYLLEGPGEVLALKGEFAQLRFRQPVPDIWLRSDQLEAYPGS
ncbi:MAG: NAD(P)H-quinone oxidoreductase [Synechococcus sp. TMED19]|nr:MAG: NAD(P)H-quinone oxidoreductase [Synechococcus sp. TMED19]